MKFEDTVYAFLKELGLLDYDVSGVDLVWDLIFPDSKGKWNHVYVTKYRKTSYISHIDGNSCSLEVAPKKSVQAMVSFGFSSYEDGCDDPASVWEPMIASTRICLKKVRKDWVKANMRVQEQYPLNRRFGVVPNSLIRASLAIEHGCELASTDSDFARFQKLKWRNPLA